MNRVYRIGHSPIVTTYPDKDFATLQARAALQGATLHRVEDDRGNSLYVVSKWNLTRHLLTMEAVAEWLNRLEGKARAA